MSDLNKFDVTPEVAGVRRMPRQVRAHLESGRASAVTCQCALDLWLRSEPGPDGRVLRATENAQAACVHGAITLSEAAAALTTRELLEEQDGAVGVRMWRWLVGEDDPQSVGSPPAPQAFGTLSRSERARLEAARPST